ncbi:MAG: hypothetical protein D4R63_03745 [Methylococcaceae bacterium]|jgi:16S rRNA (guanine1516-N2)-methyltransferase|nr:MAG: hypothetical protein D4R63_03745 [Methylococcaceae bacterium]
MLNNTATPSLYSGKLAVLYEHQDDIGKYQALAQQLNIPLCTSTELKQKKMLSAMFFLAWRDGCLRLIDEKLLKKGGLTVEIEPRPGEQRSWPAPKDSALAKALGRKTKSVIDATTGWGQDSLHIFRMGYDVHCIERSPVMIALLKDGLQRLSQETWVQNCALSVPCLLEGDAIELLSTLPSVPDAIYIDPMFPPKRKKSALAKKSMMVLRDLLGDDEDKEQLFTAAYKAAGKRVVVKSPDDAQPLMDKPTHSFKGKLLRYDVYLKGDNHD